jgi:valyl-tRNA synthetase
LIDPVAELARLDKSIRKTRAEIAKAEAKLANENFIRSAPPAVVEQERARLADFAQTLAGLERQLAQVRSLLP